MSIDSGTKYRDWVSGYIYENFSGRGIKIYQEVSVGKSIIGKKRTVNILVLNEAQNVAVALECKLQNVTGTADEKIPYALNDAQSMQMDKYVVYGGDGFSKGVKHMLEAHELACYAKPRNMQEADFRRTADTRELDHILAMKFNWWDIVVFNKSEFTGSSSL
jgi:hypothetical protein